MTQNDALWAERKGERYYVGHNANGATVEIGTGEGQFSPGELMKLALATCNTLSADHTLARELGDDFQASVGVETDKDSERNSYKHFRVEDRHGHVQPGPGRQGKTNRAGTQGNRKALHRRPHR